MRQKVIALGPQKENFKLEKVVKEIVAQHPELEESKDGYFISSGEMCQSLGNGYMVTTAAIGALKTFIKYNQSIGHGDMPYKNDFKDILQKLEAYKIAQELQREVDPNDAKGFLEALFGKVLNYLDEEEKEHETQPNE